MKSHKETWQIVFAIIVAVTLGLLLWFIGDVRNLYRSGNLRPTRGFRSHAHIQPEPANIESWMTFAYINYIFGLPANYLSSSLHIQDSRYPNLEISQYAKTADLDSTVFLSDVRNSVAHYSTSTPQ